MNYTEKYHLPQWVETDRIMMEDFNAAMAGIEEGLNEANASAASALGASESVALARLRRIGYDLCQVNARSMAKTGPSGVTHAKGLAYNGLATSQERKRVSGIFLPLGGAGWLGPICGLNSERLNSGLSNFVSASVSATYKTATASVDVSVRYSGTLTQVGVWFRQSAALNIAPPMQVKLYDKGSESYVYTSGTVRPAAISGKEYSLRTLDVSMTLEAGHDYRIELILLAESAFMGSFGLGEETGKPLAATITPIYPTSGTVTEKLTLETPAQLAVGVAHYTGDTPPVLRVNGQEMTPAALRYGADARGSHCREREFYLEGDWSGTVTLTAFFQTAAQKDTLISDVEWYLL